MARQLEHSELGGRSHGGAGGGEGGEGGAGAGGGGRFCGGGFGGFGGRGPLLGAAGLHTLDTAHAWPLTLALVGTKLEAAPEEDVCCQPRFTGLPPLGCSTCQLAAAVPAQR